MLASSLDAVVLIPDFFKGEPADIDLFPPDTDEKKAMAQKFITEKARSPEHMTNLIQTVTEAKEKWPTVESWGVFGLCWGGKV
jgi:dienelactone hydrolase